MKVIETLAEMEKLGYLQELCRGGVISPHILLYKELHQYIDGRLQCGQPKMQAITDAEEKFKIKKTTVYKALNLMNKVSGR